MENLQPQKSLFQIKSEINNKKNVLNALSPIGSPNWVNRANEIRELEHEFSAFQKNIFN